MSRPIEQITWLNLVDTVGPFLAGTVLQQIFPQGLEKIETPRRQRLRSAYEEWQEAIDEADGQLSDIHSAWVRMVFEEALEFDDEVLVSDDDMPIYSPDGHDIEYSPDHVLRSQAGKNLLFVSVYAPGMRLDQPISKDWVAAPIERMKLLCRSQNVRVGLITNGEQWALINAPADNTTGHTIWHARLWWQEPVTFKAFVSLLGMRRFFGPAEDSIDQLLDRSLAEHNEVTDTLGEQVHRAVELLIQSLGRSDDDRNGELLKGIPPAELYNAGLTVMMRLVFLLCAEERELLLLGDPVYDQNYAVSTLRAKLRDDADQHGEEVLERRYDAWSRLLTVFRGVYGGFEHESMRMPAMGGSLFDPDRFAFLEGRTKGTSWKDTAAVPLPIDNRTVMLLLRSLQVLEHRGGARQLSFRGLDVEQIGHVYEGLLEYKVERVSVLTMGLIGSSKVTRPAIGLEDLEALMDAGVSKAAGELVNVTGRSKAALTKALKKETEASDLPPLVHACGGDEDLARRMQPFTALLRTDSWGVPLVYKAGSFAVTLGAGRRESGSHYTPKALTEPIVATSLRPILEAMGNQPTAEQLLALKVCDPAMGSGAFLVEVCRQLGAHVVEAWTRAEAQGNHITIDGAVVDAPGDAEMLSAELADRLVTARRLVTERCLYGVDKNPMAVDLAKLSLWLVTMAKNRPFGFLDHKLKCGDSLVGLTKAQIQAFDWKEQKRDQGPLFEGIQHTLDEANQWRRAIGDFGEFDYSEKQKVYSESENTLKGARIVGDMCIAAFFNGQKDNAREELRKQYRNQVEAWQANPASLSELEGIVEELRAGERPVPPMHWEIEFPEVFERKNPGFDVMVGNPPFLGGTKISTVLGTNYRDWIKSQYPGSGNRMDLVAYFFRRSFSLVRQSGTFGLVATNTIRQGDTRAGGLGWLAKNGAFLYSAIRRKRWPGTAVVIVSVVHGMKGTRSTSVTLDGREVDRLTAYLFDKGTSDEPNAMMVNRGSTHSGIKTYGQGFLFADDDMKANPIDLMHQLLLASKKNKERIKPYLGGKEFNDSPKHSACRFVIDFSGMTFEQAQEWPDLLEILKRKIPLERESAPAAVKASPFWRFWNEREELREWIKDSTRYLVRSETSKYHGLAFLDTSILPSQKLVAFTLKGFSDFTVLQSRSHENWSVFFGSTMKDDPVYTQGDCFETFPFPENWQTDPTLESAGKTYYEFRAELMVRNDEGLTKTYNRFHNPSNREPDILKLRELHAAMDRAVLDAYGWHDIPTDCDFLLDYEVDEETWGNRKKPYRYRWPDAVHDEVLARLLELNQKRFEEEKASNN